LTKGLRFHPRPKGRGLPAPPLQPREINVHLKNIYESGELTCDATIRKYLTVQIEGDREVSRTLDYYNLDAIISVGYRVNSRRATQFRQCRLSDLKPLVFNWSHKRLIDNTGCFPVPPGIPV